MLTYKIIEGYFNWILRGDNRMIESTKLKDFIKISDSKGYLEWTDIVEKVEDKKRDEIYYRRKIVRLKNIKEVSSNFYDGDFIDENGKIKKVQIEVKTINLLEFLYQTEIDNINRIYFR